MTDYNAIAGFNTSTLAAGGNFAAARLTSGSAGSAIADAAFTALTDSGTAAGNGIALINAASTDAGVSPVTSLMTFIHELVVRSGNTNLIQNVGNAFFNLTRGQGATLAGASVASAAAAAAIAIAGSGSAANATAAGEELSIVLSQVRIGSGEGGASAYPTVVAQIQAAIGHGLTANQAIDMLVGMPLGYAGAGTDSQAALHTLIGSDTTKASTAIAAFATDAGRRDGLLAARGFGTYDISLNQDVAIYIGQVAGWVGFSATQVNTIIAGAIGPSLTAAQAVVLLSQLTGGTQQIVALISNNTITAANAIAAIAAGTSSSSTISALMGIATATPVNFSLQMTVARQLASMVGTGIEASSAISAIANNAQLTPAASISMLTAIGALGNVLSSNNKYSLSLIGDAVRAGSLSGADAVTAMAAGFTALGLTVDQQVTILVGVGGSSGLQQGSLVYAGRADLEAAAGQKLDTLIQANRAHFTADQLASDVAAAMTADNSVFWPTNIDVLLRVVAADTTMSGLVGAALVKLSALAPLSGHGGLSNVLGAIDADSNFFNQVLTGDQTVGILIGMAAAGNAAVQVAAGGELGSLIQRNSLLGNVNPGTNIAAALTAGTLTRSQATLLLTAAAGNANAILIKNAYQSQYSNLLASLVAADATGVINTVGDAVASATVSVHAGMSVLASIAGNSTGSAQTAATNKILALVSAGTVSATTAVNELAIAAGSAGSFIAIYIGGGVPGVPFYDDAVAYLAAYQEAAGSTVALLVTQNRLTAQAAVTAIDAAATAGKLKGVDALRMLESAAAGNASFEPLVQDEITALIANSATTGLTTSVAVAALQGMQTGASAAFATIISNELGILLIDPATLDQTAGIGSSAQIKAQAIAIAGLLSGGVQADIDTANTVLGHLGSRIASANLLPANALELLLDLAGQGTAALTAAAAELAILAQPTQTQFGPININTAISQTGAALAAGTLSGSAALVVLGRLSAVNNGGIQSVLSNAIGTGNNQITIAQLDAAIQAGTLSPADVINALGVYAKNNSGPAQAAAIAEINSLPGTDFATQTIALQALVSIGGSLDATIRAGGYAGLLTFVGASGRPNGAANEVVNLIANNFDDGVKRDAQSELVVLLSAGASAVNLVTAITAQINTLTPFQGVTGELPWLKVMVGLLAAPSAESTMMNALLARAQNAYTAYPQSPTFIADTIVADIAAAYGTDLSRQNTAIELSRLAELLVQLEPNSGQGGIAFLGVGDFLSGLASLPIPEQISLLQAIVTYYGLLGPNLTSTQSAIIDGFTTRITTLISSETLADRATYIANLFHTGSLNAIQVLISAHDSSTPADFLALLNAIAADLPSSQVHVVTDAIEGLAGTSYGPVYAIQMLLTIGLGASTVMQHAAQTSFANAMIGGVFDAPHLAAGLGGAVPTIAANFGQIGTFLANVYLARLEDVAEQGGSSTDTASLTSQLIAQMLALSPGGSSPNVGAVALAAGSSFARVDAPLVLAGFIETLLESASSNPTETLIAQAIGAAVPTITGAQAARLLASLGGDRGGNFLIPAGAEIADLVRSGALSAGDAGFYIYAAVAVDHVANLAQSLEMAIGAAGAGIPAVAAKAFVNMMSLTNASVIATALTNDVAAHKITALQAVDVAAIMATSIGLTPSTTIVDALIGAGQISGQAATAELASFIGQTASTYSVVNFIGLVAAVAAGSTAADQASIGVGLAELIVAGTITTQQVADGLGTALNGTLSIAAAMAVLLGAAADSSSAATQASIVAQIGGVIASMIGSNATYAQSAMTAITNATASLAAVNPVDSHAPLRSLLASIAAAGSSTALTAVGRELAALEHAGTLSVVDLFNLPGLPADKRVFLLASVLVLDASPGDANLRTQAASAIGGIVSNNLITSTAAYDQVEAANTAQGGSASDLLSALIKIGANTVDLGTRLFALAANGTLQWTSILAAIVAAAPGDFSLIGFAAAANARQAASPSAAIATLQDDVYAAMLAETPTGWGVFIGNRVPGALGVLIQLSLRGTGATRLDIGAELATLYSGNQVSLTDIGAALTSAAAGAPQSAVLFATMLPGVTANVSQTNAVLDQIGALATPANIAAIATAIGQAIAPVGSTVGLSVADTITALTGLAVANATPAILMAVAAGIASLVNAGRLTAIDADYYVATSSVNAPANEQFSRAALIAYLGSALGQNADTVANNIGLATVRRGNNFATQLPMGQAIAVLADLADHAGSLSNLYPTLASSIGTSLASAHWLTQFAVASSLPDAEKMALLVQIAEAGGTITQVEAGRAAGASIANFTLALAGQPVTMTAAQTVLFLAGYMLTSPVNAPAIGSILVGGNFLGSVPMTFPASATMATIDGAVNTFSIGREALTPAEAGRILASMMPSALTQSVVFNDPSYYQAIMAEYRSLLGGRLSAADLASQLLAQAAAGPDSLLSTTGQTLASLYQGGFYTQSDLINAVNSATSAHTLTAVQAVKLFTAMANVVGNNALASNVGDAVGNMIVGGQITVADVIGAVDAISHTLSLSQSPVGEFALLTRAAHYLTPAQDRELGVGFGTLLASSNYLQPSLDLIDLRTNPGDLLSVDQTTSLLLGMVGTSAFNGSQNTKINLLAGVAGELAKLISSGRQTASTAIQLFDQEITAHTLALDSVIPALVFMAVDDPADLLAGVKAEISGLVGSGRATAAQVLAALAAASSTTDFGFAPAGADAVVAGVLDSLRSQGSLTTADIIATIDSGAVSPRHGVALLVQLAGTSDAASLTLIGNEIAHLVLQGRFAAIDAGLAISSGVSAGTLPADNALSLFITIMNAGEAANNPTAVAPTVASANVEASSQIVTSLRAAVTAGALTVDGEVAFLTAISSIDNYGTTGAELQRLIVSGALSAPQLFSDFEAIAGAISGGRYFQSYGFVLGAIGNSTDVSLQITVGREIGGLIARGLFTPGGGNSSSDVLGSVQGDDATRNMVRMAAAQVGGSGAQFTVGASIGVLLNTNQLSAADANSLLESAFAAGAIDGSHLVGVLAGIATQDFNGKLAIPTAVNELISLVTSGRISVADAMAGVDAVAATISAATITSWLTIASATAALTGAVRQQIATFITEGRLTDASALNAIAAAAPRASTGTIASLMLGLASTGDAGMQIGVGAKFAGLITAGSLNATQILSNVDTAVTGHTMPAGNAVNLMLSLVSSLPNGGAGSAAAGFVASHIKSYVTAGYLTATAAASAILAATVAGPATLAPYAGALLVGLGSIGGAVSTVHAAVAAGTLAADKAVQVLAGIAGQTGGVSAAVGEILSMVNAHLVTRAQVLADLQASGSTGNVPMSFYVGLAAGADAASRAAIATMVAASGTHFGPSSDPFFTGSLQQAALDFIDVANGVKTIAQAIADIKQYAPAHNASTDAGLILLQSLLSNNGLGSASETVRQVEVDRLSLGDMGAELAERVAQGTTPTQINQRRIPVDPTAISFADAKALLTAERNIYGGTNTNIQKLFADDVYAAQGNRDFGTFTSQIIGNLIYGNSSYYVAGSGGGGFPLDQTLMVMAKELATPVDYHIGTADLTTVIEKLKVRVLNGIAETSLINAVAQGSLTVDQAIAALEKEVAVIAQGASAQDASTIRQIALGWLALKSSEYMSGNYVLVPDPAASTGSVAKPANAQTKFFLSSDVDNLYGKLVGVDYFNDVVTGLGGISSMPVGKGLNTSFTQASIMALVQSFMENAIKATGSTGSVDAAEHAADVIATPFAAGYVKVQGPNNAGVFGTVQNEVIANPKDYQSYIDLGAQIYATGIPLVGRFVPQFAGLSADTITGAGAGDLNVPLLVANVGSMVIVTIMELPAVANALGPSSTLLAGEFTIIGATAGLFGNIVSGLVHAGVDEVEDAAKALGNTFKDIIEGDNIGASGSAAEMASALFTLTYGGFKLKDVAAVAEDAGASLVDLASGHPGDVVQDLKNLGGSVVNLLKDNIFVSAISSAIESWISTVGNAVAAIVPIISDWYQWNYNYFHNIVPQTPSPVAPHANGNLLSNAQKALNEPSNYGEFYYGNAVDGYIAGSTVFIDTNGNGKLDPGEYSTTTDANGNYAVPQDVGAIIVQGGVDSSTHLTLTTTLSAPAGSTTVTALTSLVQKIAATNGGNVAGAAQQVSSAFGLGSSIDLTQTDPVGAAKAGQAGSPALVSATTAALNTLVLLKAAGATGDPTAVLAAKIANAPAGTTIDLTNAATIADIATASGVSPDAAAAIAQIASASNTELKNLISSAPDPTSLLDRATAVTIVAQGATKTALETAGNDPSKLAGAVDHYTGSNLTSAISTNLTPDQPAPVDDYAGPPRWYLDPTVTGVVSTGSASGNSLAGSPSNQQLLTSLHDAASGLASDALSLSPDAAAPSALTLAPSLDNAFHVA